MTTQELAYAEIERLVKSFKDMPAAQRRGMNEMQTRLGYVLPDGMIASLWLQRAGNTNGYHEIKLMSADGTQYAMLLTGVNVFDVGIGCGAAP